MGGGMKFSGGEVAQNLFRDCFAQNIHLHFASLVDAGKIHFIRVLRLKQGASSLLNMTETIRRCQIEDEQIHFESGQNSQTKNQKG